MGHEELESGIETAPPLPLSTREQKPVEGKRGYFERIARSKRADKIIISHGRRRSSLVHVLQDVQNEFNYLPEDILEHVSCKLEIPLSLVYSAVGFYDSFHLEPRGKHIVSVCMGTACHVRGSQRILEEIENKLKIREGETTNDMEFTLERVNCIGTCAMGPVVVLDGKCHGNLDTQKACKIVTNGS